MTETAGGRRSGGRAARQAARAVSNAVRVPYITRTLSPFEVLSVEHLELIETNADTVATAGLRSLAASADFLVVDTRHAAHAATMAFDEVRPRDRQLFSNGRGLSSFIERLRNELEAS